MPSGFISLCSKRKTFTAALCASPQPPPAFLLISVFRAASVITLAVESGGGFRECESDLSRFGENRLGVRRAPAPTDDSARDATSSPQVSSSCSVC